MRFVLPLLLLAALTGCSSPAATQAVPEQTESASAEPSQTMDPMESETMDPMETESMEDTESPEPESSASPTASATATATPTQSASPSQSAAGYTMAEVAKRNTQTECWWQSMVVSMTSPIGLDSIQVDPVRFEHFAEQMAQTNLFLNMEVSRGLLQRWTATTSAH